MPYQFTYITPDAVATNILVPGQVKYAGHTGFGVTGMQTASARVAGAHGVTYVAQRPYLPAREMIVSVFIMGSDYSDWQDINDDLSALVSPLRRYGATRLGTLKITKPNDDVRQIECLLVDDPNDSEQKKGVSVSLRHLKFWAPDPCFEDITATQQQWAKWEMAVDGGLVAPFTVPFVLTSAPNLMLNILAYTGTADAWPKLRLVGPCSNPKFYHIENAFMESVQIPVVLAAGDTLLFDMETAITSIYRAATGAWETMRRLRAGSVRWRLHPGENVLYVSAPDLVWAAGSYVEFTARYLEL